MRKALLSFGILSAVTAFSQNPLLVYHNTFDSKETTETPAVGPAGSCEGATFVDGFSGKALYVPAGTRVFSTTFSAGLPVARGCIEFRARLTDSKQNFSSPGDPTFIRIAKDDPSVPAASVGFNSNNGSGGGGLVGNLGGLFLMPSVGTFYSSYSTYIDLSALNDWHHYAIRWNTNGIFSVSGNPVAALLLDGVVVYTAGVTSTLNVDEFVGSMTQNLVMQISDYRPIYSQAPFAIDEFKIWATDEIDESSSPEAVEYEKVHNDETGADSAVVTHVVVPDGGVLEMPATLGGLPVSQIAPTAFAGCWSLERLVFMGNPPDDGLPATLLQMADSICYPAESAVKWRKILRNVGYGGWFGSYEGEWNGSNTLASDVPQPTITNYVYTTVTNVIEAFSIVTNEVHYYATTTNLVLTYATVTNVVEYVPEPGASPDAGYETKVGDSSALVIAGAAGWDAFGVPPGMEWDRSTGTLSGRAQQSGSYDVMFVNGSGASTRIMRTTVAISPFEKVVGYVGVAFSRGGSPLDSLSSYKVLPAGLKWKGGVLEGVPTKMQTLELATVDGEPVTIEIKPLPEALSGSFDGCVYLPPSDSAAGNLRTCDIGGTVKFTATQAGKLSASVRTAAKSYSFSMTSWNEAEVGEAFTLRGRSTLKTGETIEVEAIEENGRPVVTVRLLGGEFGEGGRLVVLERDVYAKSGSGWVDEAAHELMAKCKGTYQFGFDAVGQFPEMGDDVVSVASWTLRPVAKVEAAFLKVVLKENGVATVSGTLPDKTKVNVSAKAKAESVGEKVAVSLVSSAFSGKTTALPFEVFFMSDGSLVEGRSDCGAAYSVKR